MARPSLLERLQEFLPDGVAGSLPGNHVDGSDSLLRTLLTAGHIAPDVMQRFLSRDTGIPLRASLPAETPWPESIPARLGDDHEIVGLGGESSFGVVWPQNIDAVDDLSFRLGQPIERTIISRDHFESTRVQPPVGGDEIVENLFGQSELEGSEEVELIESYNLLHEDESETDDGPVIKLLNHIILGAYRARASDIHLEAEERVSRVRYRVDGALREVMKPPKRLHNPLVSRIKIMSDLDIAEKRAPQDGRMKIRIGDDRIDIRVSTIPSIFGEKIVMRVLNSSALLELSQLGFSESDEERFRSIVSRPYGIVLVTGPTGSGKTTTLYTALGFLNNKASNIITIEDPVEYQVENISQIQVNRKAGIDFASGLKSILRQDPDIIMIGEMRDEETAAIAVKAALTGHLVLSTLHTNDAAGSYARLCDMNVAPYLLASSITGIVAQRLVRRICDACRIEETPSVEELEILGIQPDVDQTFYTGRGCSECSDTGFIGRTGIYEILTPTTEVKKMILAGTLEAGCDIPGLHRMVDDAREKVLAGVISVAESCKVVRQTSIA